jgi:hypothetical protein
MPLMNEAGVPRTPIFEPISMSALISFSYFFESSAAWTFFTLTPTSPASFSRLARSSWVWFSKSFLCICQNLPSSPATRATMAAGMALGWKLSGKSRQTTRTLPL